MRICPRALLENNILTILLAAHSSPSKQMARGVTSGAATQRVLRPSTSFVPQHCLRNAVSFFNIGARRGIFLRIVSKAARSWRRGGSDGARSMQIAAENQNRGAISAPAERLPAGVQSWPRRRERGWLRCPTSYFVRVRSKLGEAKLDARVPPGAEGKPACGSPGAQRPPASAVDLVECEMPKYLRRQVPGSWSDVCSGLSNSLQTAPLPKLSVCSTGAPWGVCSLFSLVEVGL